MFQVPSLVVVWVWVIGSALQRPHCWFRCNAFNPVWDWSFCARDWLIDANSGDVYVTMRVLWEWGVSLQLNPNLEGQGFWVRDFLPLATGSLLFKGAGCSPFADVAQPQYGTALPALQQGCATADLVAGPVWDGIHFLAFVGRTRWLLCTQPRPRPSQQPHFATEPK